MLMSKFFKKRLVYFAFKRGLLSFDKHGEIIQFIYKEWANGEMYFDDYEIIYTQLMSSVRLRYDYFIFRKKL